MRNRRKTAAITIPTLWGVAALVGLLAATAPAQSKNGLNLQPQGLSRTGIYALRRIDPNLTGEGVKVGIICRSITYRDGEPQNDYRPNVGHACFQQAKLHFDDSSFSGAGISPHANAICSILFGQDAQADNPELGAFLYQGAVPAAEGHVFEFWHFVKQYVCTQTPVDVDVIAASLGSQYEDWWTRGLESLIEREGIPVVASIGNGTNVSDPPLYPGAGSNAIGVGVVSSAKTTNPATNLAHFTLAYPEYSSFGPTADGRCKPDLVAPGNCLVAATDSNSAYAASGDWSSYSTPVATGVVTLLIQAAKQDGKLDAILGQGGNCVTKAILMTAATKLPYWHKGRLSSDDDHEVPLDYVQGAGMIDAVTSYRLLKAGRSQGADARPAGWDLNRIGSTKGVQHAYRVSVEQPADKPALSSPNGMLTATLVWNRHYRTKYPFDRIAASDVHLRLELWGIDPANPNNNVLLDYSDAKADNVQHIYARTAPGYSTYTLVVALADSDLPMASQISEPYAVAWTSSSRPDTDSIFTYDLNGDGIVDDADFRLFLNNYRLEATSPNAYLLGDTNGDGVIDGKDLTAFLAKRDLKADWYTANTTN